jgi:hypothetical protein
MIHLLLCKFGGCQLDSFTAIGDSGTQEEGAQMLLDRARTDVEVSGDLFVAAPLREQAQYLFIARRYLDCIQIDHDLAPAMSSER